MLGPQATFKQQGESGNWVSNHLPHFKSNRGGLRAVHTDQFNHGPAQMLMHTGSPRNGRPSIGSGNLWFDSENNTTACGAYFGGTPDAEKVFKEVVSSIGLSRGTMSIQRRSRFISKILKGFPEI